MGVTGSEAEGQTPVRGQGLLLREWAPWDVPVMVTMFNTAEMDRWTPLPSPFDESIAIAYVENAHNARAEGSVQLAITEDGQHPLGEVLLFPTEEPDACEFAYAVGSENRGRNLAARAIRALLPVASARGFKLARLRIATDNLASQKVATGAGFTLTDDALVRRERKGYVLHMTTWVRALP